MDEIDELVSNFTQAHKKQDLFNLLMQHKVPCAPVRDLREVVNDAHMHERKALEWVEHPMYGRVCLMNSAMRYQGSETISLVPSGELGSNNQEVYADWLGLSKEQIEGLLKEEVI